LNPFLAALVAQGVISQEMADLANRTMDPVAARAWAEQQLAIAVQNGLSAQQQRLLDLVRRNDGNVTEAQLDAFWRGEDERLYGTIQPAIEEIAVERAAIVAIRMQQPDMWRLVNEQVLGWSRTYYTSANPSFVGSVRNLDQTSREQVADAFARWNRGELNDGRQGGLPALVAELGQTFDPARAERIAITEVTRIFSEAENAAAEVDPDMEYLRWDTAFDEIVCKICAPLDGRVVRKGEAFSLGIMLPPAHVNCRCGVTATTGSAAEAVRGLNNAG
jgi:SPP1 gp7 family putative phage head morphogenesis protein